MDGFAVRSSETACSPCSLPVVGSCVAGDLPSAGTIGGAWEIMTGAPVPTGYDAVVKIEDVTITERNAQGRPERITLSSPVSSGDHVRQAGEDFRPGSPVLEAGVRISSLHLMALAAVGGESIRVYPKPRVSVLSTGREVVDDITADLQPGQIRNSNGPYLMAALNLMQATPLYLGTIHDEPDQFEACVGEALKRSDVIISTGAVSAGRHDFIPDSLRRLGAEILFHKVAIRPGKPVLYARFSNGVHYVGLPGNPISTAVGARFFVSPLLRHLSGCRPEIFPQAQLAQDARSSSSLRFFLKATAFLDARQRLCVRLLDGQESFKIHPLLHANCWALLPAGKADIPAGTPVDIAPLTGEFPFLPVSGE